MRRENGIFSIFFFKFKVSRYRLEKIHQYDARKIWRIVRRSNPSDQARVPEIVDRGDLSSTGHSGLTRQEVV